MNVDFEFETFCGSHQGVNSQWLSKAIIPYNGLKIQTF